MFHGRLVADVDLPFFEERRHGDDHREILRVALEVVDHRQHGLVPLAGEHDLGGVVENLGVGLGDVEAAKGVGVSAQCQEAGQQGKQG